MKQLTLPTIDEFFLAQRIEEAREVIGEAIRLSEKPLILNFSGGRDSMAVLGLVMEQTKDFVCFYMISGLEAKEMIDFVKEVTHNLGVDLLLSDPSLHKGDFFERLAKFRRFPTIESLWCNRDLKIRPQKKALEAAFGKGQFYKLCGVRRNESYRRRTLYPDDRYFSTDPEHKSSLQVFPLLNWCEADVINYLERVGLPTHPAYQKFTISGCLWCPFYGPEIYKKVLLYEPNAYGRIIEWEKKLEMPSVLGNIYLRDLKQEVLSGLR